MLAASIGLLIPLELLKLVWLIVGECVTVLKGIKAFKLLGNAKKKKKEQLITMSNFVQEIENIARSDFMQEVNLDFAKEQDRTSLNYMNRLLESRSELMPYVQPNIIQDCSFEYLKLKRIYGIVFGNIREDGIYSLLDDGTDVEQ